MFIPFLLYLYWALPHSCGEAMGSTVRLASPDPECRIFICMVLQTRLITDSPSSDYGFYTRVRVTEELLGRIGVDTLDMELWHHTPQPGEHWLMYAYDTEGKIMAGGYCNETTRLPADGATPELARLRAFRDARTAPGFHAIRVNHDYTGRLAAAGAFLNGKPFGPWVHYLQDGRLRARFNFDSTGRKDGWNRDFKFTPSSSLVHYTHGFPDSGWYFRDTLGQELEGKEFRTRTRNGLSESGYRYDYNSTGRIRYVEHTRYDYPPTQDTTGQKPRWFETTKTFTPPIADDSLYTYDPERAVWRAQPNTIPIPKL